MQTPRHFLEKIIETLMVFPTKSQQRARQVIGSSCSFIPVKSLMGLFLLALDFLRNIRELLLSLIFCVDIFSYWDKTFRACFTKDLEPFINKIQSSSKQRCETQVEELVLYLTKEYFEKRWLGPYDRNLEARMKRVGERGSTYLRLLKEVKNQSSYD